MNQKEKKIWKELPPCLCHSKFIIDDNANILAISYKKDGIYRFNENKKDKHWQLHTSYPDQTWPLQQLTPVVYHNESLYFLPSNKIIILDFDRKIFNTKHIDLDTKGGKTIFIKDELHLFIGTIHYKLNQDKFERVPTSSKLSLNETKFTGNGLCYVTEKDIIYIFGGKNDGRRMNGIWCYDIKQNIMSKSTIKLPIALSDFMYCYHNGSGNIFIVGGCNTFGVPEYDIIIWNIQTMIIRISDIKLSGAINNDKKFIEGMVIVPNPSDELVVIGYLKKYFKNIVLPSDIINSIKMWYKCDRMHIFGSGAHYRIDIMTILQSGSIDKTVERPPFTQRFAFN